MKLLTSASQSCYCFQLSSPGHRTGAACSKTAAEQSASLPTARLLLCGPTGCSSRDWRACTRRSNRLQSIRQYQGHMYVAKYTAIRRGELPAALRQSRLHSISTGDNRALIVWDNKSQGMCKSNWLGSFNICAAEWHMAIGDFPATDAERLCFTPVWCRSSTSFPPSAGDSASASSARLHFQALQIPSAVSASRCAVWAFCFQNTSHQLKPGYTEKYS